MPVAATIIGIVLFAIVPRFLLRADTELIEPTTRLRFLRALSHSDYKRVGQHDFRVEGQTLIVNWDLRWNTLPETKQHDIVHAIGRAWQVVGGGDTQLRIEGLDDIAGSYKSGEVQLLR